jgi:predicted alpha/beta-hydrolase family hydrolase
MEVKSHTPHRLTINVSEGQAVSGLLLVPDRPKACVVLAHGAGAGMEHPFMTAVAMGMHDRGLATLRYQFLYIEKGSRRPDRPAVAQATVQAAVAETSLQFPGLPLFAGGKSFGGRMTSQAQADSPLPRVRGIILLGFPLHLANKPSVARAQHLFDVKVPMLFLQGDRDALADPALIRQVAGAIGQRATLATFPDADHSFHVPVRSGRTDEQVMASVLDVIADWIDRVAPESDR